MMSAPDQENDDEAPTVLFEPLFIGSMLFVSESLLPSAKLDATPPAHRGDKLVRLEMRDSSSAWLVFFNDDEALLARLTSAAEDAEADLFKLKSTKTSQECRFPVDLLTNFNREREEIDSESKTPSLVQYRYSRCGIEFRFEISPLLGETRPTSAVVRQSLTEMLAFDFALGQFAFKDDSMDVVFKRDVALDSPGSQPLANPVARGLEASGTVARNVLKGSGRVTGSLIRYLGSKYTSLVVSNRKPTSKNSPLPQALEGSPVLIDEYDDNDRPSFWAFNASGDEDPKPVLLNRQRERRRYQEQQEMQNRQESPSDIHPPNASIDRVAQRALSRRRWAENVHNGSRTITSAALFPIRWVGRQGTKMSGRDVSAGHHQYQRREIRQARGSLNSEAKPNDSSVSAGADTGESGNLFVRIGSSTRRVVWDTMGGLGNGLVSACKGFTEAMTEVGNAIGDTAMNHALAVHGEEYAERVTKQNLLAARALGLSVYQVLNVAALGLVGLTVDAVIEGVALYLSLYDYLLGPVLIQGYCEMIHLPLVKRERFFVVLRPWSLSFYRSSDTFTQRPFKIIVTSLLDTMPRLREGIEMVSSTPFKTTDQLLRRECSAPQPFIQDEIVEHESPNSDPHSEAKDGAEDDDDLELWESEGLQYLAPFGMRSRFSSKSENKALGVSSLRERPPSEISSPSSSRREQVLNILQCWAGSNRPHIELCTLDCSTYLLYPPVEDIRHWFSELQSATQRVETVSKRRSGAEEIATLRRLSMWSRTHYLRMQLIRVVFMGHESEKRVRQESLAAELNAREQALANAEGLDGRDVDSGADEVASVFEEDQLLSEFEEDYDLDDFLVIDSADNSNPNVQSSYVHITHSVVDMTSPVDPADATALSSETVLSQLRRMHNPFRPHLDDDDIASLDVELERPTVAQPINASSPIVVQGMRVPQQSSASQLAASFSRGWSLLHKKVKDSYNDSTRQMISVSGCPVAFNDLKVTREEKMSSKMPVYSLAEYASKLQACIGRMLDDESRLLTSRGIDNEFHGESIFGVEHEAKREKLLRLLNEFARVDPTKRIADWDVTDIQDKDSSPSLSPTFSASSTVRCEKARVDPVDVDNDAYEFQSILTHCEPNAFIFGNSVGILSSDIHSISFSLESHVLMSRLILGTASFLMSDIIIDGTTHEVWLPVIHARSGRHVANILVSYQIESSVL